MSNRTLARTPESSAAPENTRARLVGSHDGFLAESIIVLVRASRSTRTALSVVVRSVSAVVTPLGWATLGIMALAFLVGYVLGWVEMVTIAWTLLLLIAAAAVFLIGRSRYRVSLDLPLTRVVVGEKAPGGVLVDNPGTMRLAGASIEVPVGAGIARFTMPPLPAGGRFDEVFVVSTRRRGVIPVGPVRTVRGDPIGLVRREIIWSERAMLFVHPRTIRIPSTTSGFIRDLEGTPTRDLTASDISFHALREYQPGDDRRHIHWKSSAKTGRFMVRQFEETRRSHLMVALDLDPSSYADDDEFELAVGATGSLGARAIGDSRSISVIVSERTPDFARRRTLAVRSLPTASRERLLDDLCTVATDVAFLSLTDTARIAAELVAGISLAFIVTGSATTIQSLRTAAATFPAGVQVVAVIAAPESSPAASTAGDLRVLTIGYLEDLAAILSRSSSTAI